MYIYIYTYISIYPAYVRWIGDPKPKSRNMFAASKTRVKLRLSAASPHHALGVRACSGCSNMFWVFETANMFQVFDRACSLFRRNETCLLLRRRVQSCACHWRRRTMHRVSEHVPGVQPCSGSSKQRIRSKSSTQRTCSKSSNQRTYYGYNVKIHRPTGTSV